jgi:hypothetical protein
MCRETGDEKTAGGLTSALVVAAARGVPCNKQVKCALRPLWLFLILLIRLYCPIDGSCGLFAGRGMHKLMVYLIRLILQSVLRLVVAEILSFLQQNRILKYCPLYRMVGTTVAAQTKL